MVCCKNREIDFLGLRESKFDYDKIILRLNFETLWRHLWTTPYLNSGRHFDAGKFDAPDLTTARYSLWRLKISSLKSGRFFRPRPEGSCDGHWGPTPQYLQPVCRSPPYQASQYFVLNCSSQIGVSTTDVCVDKPSQRSGSMRSNKWSPRVLLTLWHFIFDFF